MESKLLRRLSAAPFLALLLVGNPLLADQLQDDFDAALQAIDQNQLRTARERLTTLLATNPSLSRARLELARVYYLSQDYPQARAEAQRVADDPNTPPAVRTTVLAFLAQIDADQKQNMARHHWTPSIYAGLMFDSNVNVGPSRDIIDINGTPGFVLPESQEKDDYAMVISPGIAHTYNPGRRFEAGEQQGFFVWQSQANGYYRAYADEDDYNLGILTLRTGPAWIVPGRWRAGIGLQGDQIFLGGDNLAWFTTLNPNITWELGNDTELSLDGIATDRRYHDNDEDGRDGLYLSANAILTHYFRNRTIGLQGGIGYADFDADDDRFGYKAPDLMVGVIVDAWQGGSVYARLNYRNYDFDGPEPAPFAPTTRDEDEVRVSLGFQHEFRSDALQNWVLLGSWVHTDNDSNVGIYEYDRDIVNLGMARNF
ncbi:MAG: tetratricopeptide repeat protein [Gammaproteobacteria bacterium]